MQFDKIQNIKQDLSFADEFIVFFLQVSKCLIL